MRREEVGHEDKWASECRAERGDFGALYRTRRSRPTATRSPPAPSTPTAAGALSTRRWATRHSQSGTKIELAEAQNDIEAVLAAGGRAPAPPLRCGWPRPCARRAGCPINARVDEKIRQGVPSDWTRSSEIGQVMEQGESVMVAAHFRGEDRRGRVRHRDGAPDGQRVVYTAPLKALSNQSSGAQGRVQGRGPDDRRHRHQRDGVVSHDEWRCFARCRTAAARSCARWVGLSPDSDKQMPVRRRLGRDGYFPRTSCDTCSSATIPNAKEFAEWIVKTHSQFVSSRVTPSPDAPRALHLPRASTATCRSIATTSSGRITSQRQRHRPRVGRVRGEQDREQDGDVGGRSGDGKGKGEEMKHLEVYKIVKMIADKNHEFASCSRSTRR